MPNVVNKKVANGTSNVLRCRFFLLSNSDYRGNNISNKYPFRDVCRHISMRLNNDVAISETIQPLCRHITLNYCTGNQ